MSNSSLHTVNPVALRYLMTETIFGIEEVGDAGVAIVQERKSTDASPQFSYYGGNKRNYLFLTHDPQHEWMSGVALEAFAKTLAALKLSVDDVAVLNIGKLSEVPTEVALTTFFHPKLVVLLGVSVPWVGSESLQVFKTHSFDEMLVDAEKKRAFWTTAKTLFIG